MSGACDADRSSVSMTTASGRLLPPPLQPRVPLDCDDGSIVVAKFVGEHLNKTYDAAAGPSHDGQAPDQPNVAGRDDDDDCRTGGCFKMVCIPGQKVLFSYCLSSSCYRYLQHYCSAARFFRAADALAYFVSMFLG